MVRAMKTNDDSGERLLLREEETGDHAAIAALNEPAFGQPGEAAMGLDEAALCVILDAIPRQANGWALTTCA